MLQQCQNEINQIQNGTAPTSSSTASATASSTPTTSSTGASAASSLLSGLLGTTSTGTTSSASLIAELTPLLQQLGLNVTAAPTAAPATSSTSVSGGSAQTSGITATAVPAQYQQIFQQAAATYGVPVSMLEAVSQVESNYNPNAVSSAGAQGMMQIMPGTAKGLGINPLDPTQAINGAAQLLSEKLNAFGSVPLALAAYNAGDGAVEQYGGIPPYPETQNYVTKVTSVMSQLGGS